MHEESPPEGDGWDNPRPLSKGILQQNEGKGREGEKKKGDVWDVKSSQRRCTNGVKVTRECSLHTKLGKKNFFFNEFTLMSTKKRKNATKKKCNFDKPKLRKCHSLKKKGSQKVAY